MARVPAAPSPEMMHRLLAIIEPGARVRAIQPVVGSFSNATHAAWVVMSTGAETRLILRQYVQHGTTDPGQKARREFKALELLQAHNVPAPSPIYLDQDGDILGSPGIVTSFVVGRQEVAPANPGPWARALAQTLAQIHSIPCPAERNDFLMDGNRETLWFLDNDDVPEFMQRHEDGRLVWTTLRDAAPALHPVAPALLHLDYWLGNILWEHDRISAVVDWEEAGCGDPAIDVAYHLIGLVVEGMPAAADEFLATYEAAMGRQLENLAFWELAAAARNMPDPAQWVDEWVALGGPRETKAIRCERFRDFIRKALDRL